MGKTFRPLSVIVIERVGTHQGDTVNRKAVGIIALVLVIAGGVQAWRALSAAPIEEAAQANAGDLAVSVHMQGVDASTYVLDVTGDAAAAPVDLVRIALATCVALHREGGDRSLVLARNGDPKFSLAAATVDELADDTQKPLYRARILVARAVPEDGGERFSDPEGGALYVLSAIAENTTAFAKRWMGIQE